MNAPATEPATREARVLAVAADLLPNHPEVWNQGFLDVNAMPPMPSNGERVIADLLEQAWRCTGTFGALVNLPPADREALLGLVKP